MATTETSEAINQTCPTSGKPIDPDAVLTHEGKTIAFCSKDHRDQFKSTLDNIAQAIAKDGKTAR